MSATPKPDVYELAAQIEALPYTERSVLRDLVWQLPVPPITPPPANWTPPPHPLLEALDEAGDVIIDFVQDARGHAENYPAGAIAHLQAAQKSVKAARASARQAIKAKPAPPRPIPAPVGEEVIRCVISANDALLDHAFELVDRVGDSPVTADLLKAADLIEQALRIAQAALATPPPPPARSAPIQPPAPAEDKDEDAGDEDRIAALEKRVEALEAKMSAALQPAPVKIAPKPAPRKTRTKKPAARAGQAKAESAAA